ncbi:MAG TPA: hydroxyethylthiazole kinase, partial [Xanthobacteraceae bacterium]|nr:hydroxyethylthiazole kinase [Xanthobacteraceae bacterium]
MHAPVELADIAADVLARIRDRAPRVHCITNTVAQNYTANMLLAAGAVPSMTIAPEEIVSFVASADALLVNLGTFDEERRRAVDVALSAVQSARMPWVLDPVFIERSPGRAQYARDLLAHEPSVVRLNAAEFAPLFGGDPADEAASRVAQACTTVVALTG